MVAAYKDKGWSTLSFSEKGIKVIGFDLNKSKINNLESYKSFINTISDERISKSINNKNFYPTSEINDLKNCDIYIICVPTPLTNTRDPDLSYIESALNKIYPLLDKGNLISLESTTYPGTTEEIILPTKKPVKELRT